MSLSNAELRKIRQDIAESREQSQRGFELWNQRNNFISKAGNMVVKALVHIGTGFESARRDAAMQRIEQDITALQITSEAPMVHASGANYVVHEGEPVVATGIEQNGHLVIADSLSSATDEANFQTEIDRTPVVGLHELNGLSTSELGKMSHDLSTARQDRYTRAA